jgi:hypothetical protein
MIHIPYNYSYCCNHDRTNAAMVVEDDNCINPPNQTKREVEDYVHSQTHPVSLSSSSCYVTLESELLMPEPKLSTMTCCSKKNRTNKNQTTKEIIIDTTRIDNSYYCVGYLTVLHWEVVALMINPSQQNDMTHEGNIVMKNKASHHHHQQQSMNSNHPINDHEFIFKFLQQQRTKSYDINPKNKEYKRMH